jgi:hypothetical protein
MPEFREKYHRIMFLTARILSLLITLAWLGLMLSILYMIYGRSKIYALSFTTMIKLSSIPFITLVSICIFHILLTIYIQQRRKWAVACMFVLATIEFTFAGFYYFAAYAQKAPAFYYLIITSVVIPLGVLIWSLSESYKAINLERSIIHCAFEPVMKAQVIQPENKP